jgi:hypothetical protein
MFGAPYDLGIPFVRVLITDDARDRAFLTPPLSEENVLDPASFFATQKPLSVDLPKTPAGAKRITSQGFTVGAVTWYVMLATYTDQKQALKATIGWGGDAMRVYEQGDRLCAALRFRGDTTTDAAQMESALTTMTKALPKNDPVLTRANDVVDLTLCDPGTETTLPKVDASLIFDAPALRSLLIADVLDDARGDVAVAACAVDKSMDKLASADIDSLLAAQSPDDPKVTAVRADLARSLTGCR